MKYLTPQDRLDIANDPVSGLERVAERIAKRARDMALIPLVELSDEHLDEYGDPYGPSHAYRLCHGVRDILIEITEKG